MKDTAKDSKIMKPEIQSIIAALEEILDLHNVTYQEETNTFLGTAMAPVRCYDSGGSLDSVGFEEFLEEIPYDQAYWLWVSYLERQETSEVPEIIPPLVNAEDILPF